jgi:hypothetical protein
MKRIFFLLTIALQFTVALFAQEVLATTAQIGPFSLNQKLSSVEQILLKKLNKAEVKTSVSEYDKPVKVSINGVAFELSFGEDYDDKGNIKNEYIIKTIKCKSKLVKTKSGIAVGWQKYDVLKKLDGLGTEYEYRKSRKYDNDGKKLATFYEVIMVFDGVSGKNLALELQNGEVVSFELYYAEGC